jgi:hypothetical protein
MIVCLAKRLGRGLNEGINVETMLGRVLLVTDDG